MEFKSRLKKSDIKEICDKIFPKSYWLLIQIVALAFVAGAVRAFFVYNLSTAFIVTGTHIIGIVFIEYVLKYQKKKTVQIMKKRLDERTSEDYVENSISFRGDEILSTSTTSNNMNEIKYSALDCCIESAHYLILYTKARTYLPIQKEIAEEKHVKEFLKKKNSNIKFR